MRPRFWAPAFAGVTMGAKGDGWLPIDCGHLHSGYFERMDKRSRLAGRLDDLEREYRHLLIRALRDCAAGRWGLFGQNDHTGHSNTPTELDDLRVLAASIDNIRDRLALPSFNLHEEFESARGRVGANALGEARLARIWLTKLTG